LFNTCQLDLKSSNQNHSCSVVSVRLSHLHFSELDSELLWWSNSVVKLVLICLYVWSCERRDGRPRRPHMWIELLASLSTKILADFRQRSYSTSRPEQIDVKMGLAQQKKYGPYLHCGHNCRPLQLLTIEQPKQDLQRSAEHPLGEQHRALRSQDSSLARMEGWRYSRR
jgi:hypothetical protein